RYIVKLSAIENTFAIHSTHSTRGPTTFDSPDLAPLLVLCELLNIMEGILLRVEFDKSELEAAKSGVIYGLVNKEAAESFGLQVLNNLGSGFNKKLISKVQ
ncbi:15907_t:CDS:2, partial [Gigaspora rosea]